MRKVEHRTHTDAAGDTATNAIAIVVAIGLRQRRRRSRRNLRFHSRLTIATTDSGDAGRAVEQVCDMGGKARACHRVDAATWSHSCSGGSEGVTLDLNAITTSAGKNDSGRSWLINRG